VCYLIAACFLGLEIAGWCDDGYGRFLVCSSHPSFYQDWFYRACLGLLFAGHRCTCLCYAGTTALGFSSLSLLRVTDFGCGLDLARRRRHLCMLRSALLCFSTMLKVSRLSNVIRCFSFISKCAFSSEALVRNGLGQACKLGVLLPTADGPRRYLIVCLSLIGFSCILNLLIMLFCGNATKPLLAFE
jgi:hypothetical protein